MKKRFIAILLTAACALTLLTGCSSTASEKVDQYRSIGIKQLESGDYEAAVQSFQRALDQSTGVIGEVEKDTCLYKALAQIRNGQKNEALEAYTALVDYDKKFWKAYYLRANLELSMGKNEEAYADYEAATGLNDAIQLYVSIYQNLMACGENQRALTYMQKAEAKTSATGEDYYWLAQLYLINGDYTKAMDYASKSESAGYDDGTIIGAKILISMGQSEQAKDKLDIYLNNHPNDPKALGQLGVVAFSAGDYSLAIEYIKKAMETEGFDNDPDTIKNLVAAYEYSGDFEAACEVANSYMDLYPNDEEMERELEFLENRKMGNFVKEVEETTEEDQTTKEEQTTEGQTTEGQTTEGQTTDGQSTEGQTTQQ